MNCYFSLIKFFLFVPWIWDNFLALLYKKCFKSCGCNVYLRPSKSDFKGLSNISIGDNVSIPKGSTFYSTEANLIIKNNVVFGPKPTIITGDHRIDVIGTPIIHSLNKLSTNDQDVVIEEDVWIGANVVILKGVTIGRGSVVAAGATVTKSCAPYSIIGGVPAKLIKYRFTIDQILEHESLCYSPSQRYTRKYLESTRHGESTLPYQRP